MQFRKTRGLFCKITLTSLSLPFLSPAMRWLPRPPARRAASPPLPARIEAEHQLRRRRLSLLAADRPQGRRARAGIAAAAPATLRRVSTPPRPLRRPKRGVGAAYAHHATRRVGSGHARVPERRGAPPASSTPPRPSQPVLATVTSDGPRVSFFFLFQIF